MSPPRTAHSRFIQQKNREAMMSERGPRVNAGNFFSRAGVSGAATAAVTTREKKSFVMSRKEPYA
jgi:hypothetical protein